MSGHAWLALDFQFWLYMRQDIIGIVVITVDQVCGFVYMQLTLAAARYPCSTSSPRSGLRNSPKRHSLKA